ncbi:MAG TPA: hypothetical protein VF177_22385 [Anaerolineae bacterium]
MKQRSINVIWGLILILAGVVFLAEQLGLIPDLAATLWGFIFAGASLLYFITYFTAGVSQWGWLFPATITAGLAGTIWLAEAGVEGTLAGALFMASVSLPFWLVYVVDRRANWWALIPGWATAVITLVILLADRVAGEFIGTLVLLGIALPFFAVYLANRKHWWALIPAFILSGVGLVVLLAAVASGEAIGALVLFSIALPFFVVYFRFREHWWALIPAGILASTGVVTLLATIEMSEAVAARVLGGVLFVGMAATFGWLWLQRDHAPTDWARYPAAGLAVAALLVLALGTRMEVMWPVVLIAIGLWLLYDTSRRPKLRS